MSNYEIFCPIVMLLEEVQHPRTSNILKKLLPYFKNSGFTILALEEMQDRSLDNLVNDIYKPLAFLEIINSTEPKKNLAMYQLLQAALKLDMQIENIDLVESTYIKLNQIYSKLQVNLTNQTENLLTIEAMSTLQTRSSEYNKNSANKDLAEDIILSIFSSNPKKSGLKALAKHSAESYYSSKALVEFFETLLASDFNHKRSQHFAERIDHLCAKHKTGMALLVGSFHGKTAKILAENGYLVKAYYIEHEEPEHNIISKFIKYNPEAANRLLLHDRVHNFNTTLSQEEIVHHIKEECDEYFFSGDTSSSLPDYTF